MSRRVHGKCDDGDGRKRCGRAATSEWSITKGRTATTLKLCDEHRPEVPPTGMALVHEERLFKPNGNLMAQLDSLTERTAPRWWKEYVEYHGDGDTGVGYAIGYLQSEKKRGMLRKAFNMS